MSNRPYKEAYIGIFHEQQFKGETSECVLLLSVVHLSGIVGGHFYTQLDGGLNFH